MRKDSDKISVCYALAYREPNYIRTRVLLGMLNNMGGVEPKTAINKHKGLVRYFETFLKVLWVRLRHKPDIYIIGFSGYELFWPVRLLSWPKPVVFDEFINAYNWFVEEHNKVPAGSWRSKILHKYVRLILNNSSKILTDTELHAQSSSKTYGIPLYKYQTIYVGADEELFTPVNAPADKENQFTAFFYGNFIPLHGLQHILEAAKKLRGLPIKFVIVGGANKEQQTELLNEYIRKNQLENVRHYAWIDFDKLPDHIAGADICLGGPFGDTPQSQKVITGKTFQFLAMRKPVIVGKIEEKIGFVDKENCLLVPQKNSKALAEAIEWAYHNTYKLEEMGQNGYSLYHGTFSVKAQTPVLLSILREATSKKS